MTLYRLPRQLHQRVFHVDDLIKPRAEQILLAGLPSLAWSHRKSPLHQRASEKNHGLRFEGILKIEFARKSPSNGQKPANSDYLSQPNHPAHSIAFKFFTDDLVV